MNAVQLIALPNSLFAQVLLFWQLLPGSLRETLIVVAAMATISIVVLAWAVLFRKPGRRHHHHRHHRSHHKEHAPEAGPALRPSRSGNDASEPADEAHEPRRKWRRRRRRDHRPRNPTLAETGGLPPVRTRPPIDPGL